MLEGYRYETHLHTKEASACSKTWAVDYIQPFIEAGYSGIIVTDHFFNGNTNIPATLPWAEQVSLFCRGYERAKQEGAKHGLSVFFGFEFSCGNDEYLIYGLDKKWLFSHPEVVQWDQMRLFQEVDKLGGCMVQAHPFRERDYLDSIHLYPYAVHAIEAGNAENEAEFDRKAFAYAQNYALAMSCGNDIHDVNKIGPASMAVQFDKPLRSIDDFIAAIKRGGTNHLFMDQQRMQKPFNKHSHLPIKLYDKTGKSRRLEAWQTWT